MIYKLTADGIDILDYSNNITFDSDCDTLSCTLKFDSLSSIRMGGVISLFIDGFEVFRGTVVDCQESKFTYAYTCYDYGQYLNNEVVKQFNKVDATRAMSTLLLEYDISHAIINIPTVIDHFYKDESIASIVDDILEQCQNDQGKNYYKEIIGNMLYIDDLETKYIYPKFIIENDNNIGYSLTNMKNKIIVVSGDEDSAKVQAVAYDPYSKGRYGLYQQVETIDDKDIAQAQNVANNLLKQFNRVEHETTLNIVVLDRGETIRANRLIYIETDKLKGWYKISSATHTVTNGIHKASIKLEW